jgi:hypothetical protein
LIPWIIIRTDIKKEAKVYEAIIDMGFEAWLPIEPRFTRINPHVKIRRQWWGAILPCRFFAAIPPSIIGELRNIRYYAGMDRDASGMPLCAPESVIQTFRSKIEEENAKLLRENRNHDEGKPGAIRKVKPSRRLKRGK